MYKYLLCLLMLVPQLMDQTPEYLYKILSLENWEKSQSEKKVVLSKEDFPFIHLATLEQLDRIIEKYWGTAAGYVILKLETAKLSGRLVLESNPGGTNKYFHLYDGGIPLDAVLEAKIVSSQARAELQHEVENSALEIRGTFPEWLSGTLVRNGPITVTIDGQKNSHWFDGLAMLHAFSFQNGKVNYSNKFLRSKAYETVFKEGSLHYDGFASDPCRSLFKSFLTFFLPQAPQIQNANVNVAKIADAYVALTESPLPVKFDAKTLKTLGVLDYQDALPKDRCWESAHPHYDVEQKCTLNYLIQYGKKSLYTFYSLQEGSLARKTLAEVAVEEPAYMHSFGVSENYFLLTEFPFVVKPLDFVTKNRPFIHNFSWHPERGTRFIVVSRKTGKVVGNYLTRPFFAFHHANMFEMNGHLFLDSVTYNDASIITALQDTSSPEHFQPQLERFSLNLSNGKITSEVLLKEGCEFPRIHEKKDGKPYQYVYLTGVYPKEALYKVNTDTKETLHWAEKGCSPGEPVFVPHPKAHHEDEGVVLAVVLDHIKKNSFLLILEGQSFKELGRAYAPHLIPEGLHGQYFLG